VRLRSALLFAFGLGLVCSVAWAAQQRGGFEDPVLSGGAVPTGAFVVQEEPSPGGLPTPASEPLPDAPPVIDPAWANRVADQAGIPAVAAAAYARATLRVPAGCHLGWTTLAGIGWIESQHGTVEDRTLGADGRPSTPIIGPRLDGAGAVAAIPAPRGSETWHGDPTWDHAVGPMQFISDTWLRWSSDGDGDGIEDPHDLDDAAYAAASYLCASGFDLATGEGWAQAVHSYNHAHVYVDAVRVAASTYAERAG
jgi:membrane-bound lytic murein transglycosylase B